MGLSYNKVILIGDVSDDPKLSKFADSDSVWFNLRLEHHYTRDGQVMTGQTFLRCTADGATGKRASTNTAFKKGANVTCEGSLVSKKNQDGKWELAVRVYNITVNDQATAPAAGGDAFPF